MNSENEKTLVLHMYVCITHIHTHACTHKHTHTCTSLAA